MENKREHYGLITATAMIVGIVIGSGIYFKGDDILLGTGGNVMRGVLVFCIGAFSIIFGNLTLSELSVRSGKSGGVIGFYEGFISKKVASGFGWFQGAVYLPTINAVVSWAAGIYTCLLLGLDFTLENQILIGSAYMVLIFALNILSVKLGGYFQNLATVTKLIPLLVIAAMSVFLGPQNPQIPADVEVVTKTDVGFKWVAALVPIAFSYDGWIVALSITDEVKRPKRNMPLALTIGPLIVLGVYLVYFLGLNNMLGAEFIMSMKDSAVNTAGNILLGTHGATIINVFVIISILGVVNGLTLGSLRVPQTLASKNMLPASGKIEKIDQRIELSWGSCAISFALTAFWMVIHYITQKLGILRGDISDIAIVFSYACYALLYVKVIKMKLSGEIKSVFKGIICPVFALMGSAIIVIGGVVSNPLYVPIFMAFCFLVGVIGYMYYNNRIKNEI